MEPTAEISADLGSISQFFEDVGDRIGNWSDAAPGFFSIIRDDVMLRFQTAPSVETGGAVWGDVFWRPLDEGYIMQNPRRKGGQILRDSETLMRSVVNVSDSDHFEEVTPESFRFGTNVPYAGKMQEKFPFLFWHPILLERVSDYLTNWYLTGEERP